MSSYVVKSEAGFWTGTSWNEEYPNALEFMKRAAAVVAAKKIASELPQGRGLERIEVVVDLGYETERVIAQYRGAPAVRQLDQEQITVETEPDAAMAAEEMIIDFREFARNPTDYVFEELVASLKFYKQSVKKAKR